MATTTIDAEVLKKLFLAGAANLEAKKEWINDLNVFPVPDGDTGTNMTLTIMSAAKEVNSLAAPTMQTLSKAISGGSLRGANKKNFPWFFGGTMNSIQLLYRRHSRRLLRLHIRR